MALGLNPVSIATRRFSSACRSLFWELCSASSWVGGRHQRIHRSARLFGTLRNRCLHQRSRDWRFGSNGRRIVARLPRGPSTAGRSDQNWSLGIARRRFRTVDRSYPLARRKCHTYALPQHAKSSATHNTHLARPEHRFSDPFRHGWFARFVHHYVPRRQSRTAWRQRRPTHSATRRLSQDRFGGRLKHSSQRRAPVSRARPIHSRKHPFG